jgi:hypothetical protein
MKFESLKDGKFEKLEFYQLESLENVYGGTDGGFTWWWSDTNVTKESSATLDSESSWNADATTKDEDIWVPEEKV